MRPIPIYQPTVKVTLFKTIGRKTLDGTNAVSQRFIQTNQTLDLTAWIGEGGGFRTSKSVREPAGGFSITLVDMAYSQGGSMESMYGLIEPQDFIEFRMRHNAPSGGTAARPPILMRGFVSSVSRCETMGQDGKSARTVTIAGQDYGKIWQILQISYILQYVVGEEILSNFGLLERFGISVDSSGTMPGLIQSMISKIVNPFLKQLMPTNSPNPTQITIDNTSMTPDVSVPATTTSMLSIQSAQGTIYSIMQKYGDVGNWNELYLEDREDGVHCVYRPNPFFAITGNKQNDLIQKGAPLLTPFVLSDEDIISINVSRSDENVANYYWVQSALSELNSQGATPLLFAAQTSSKGTVDLSKYLNTEADYYGPRLMNIETAGLGSSVTTPQSGQTAMVQSKRDESVVGWINQRRADIVNQNKDNVLLESGSIRIRANENIRPGTYLQLVRGNFTAVYYVVAVETDYVPFQGVFATLAVERGTGFIQRIKSGGVSSPYLAELTGATNGV